MTFLVEISGSSGLGLVSLSDFALPFFLLPLSLIRTWVVRIVSIGLTLSFLEDLACSDELCCEILVDLLDA